MIGGPFGKVTSPKVVGSVVGTYLPYTGTTTVRAGPFLGETFTRARPTFGKVTGNALPLETVPSGIHSPDLSSNRYALAVPAKPMAEMLVGTPAMTSPLDDGATSIQTAPRAGGAATIMATMPSGTTAATAAIPTHSSDPHAASPAHILAHPTPSERQPRPSSPRCR